MVTKIDVISEDINIHKKRCSDFRLHSNHMLVRPMWNITPSFGYNNSERHKLIRMN